ncbi:MAG: hypothetical protein RLZZ502_462 [Pseudomonadota bacterium]|jgi:SM-20-related protein
MFLNTGTLESLSEQGFAVHHTFFASAELQQLSHYAHTLKAQGHLREAGISKQGVMVKKIRGDAIKWLEPDTQEPLEQMVLACLEQIRIALNHELHLSLHDFEAHFAYYPIGKSYALHVDRFRQDDARVLSCVIYLNHAWPCDAGGELLLYRHQQLVLKLAPTAGSAVLFRSELFPHEVLSAKQERYSIAAWFKQRPLHRPHL